MGEKSTSDGGDTGPKGGSVCRKYEEMRLQRGQLFMDAEDLGQNIIIAHNSEGPIVFLAVHLNCPHNPMVVLK